MENLIWVSIILLIVFFSFFVSQKINFINYKIFRLIKNIKNSSKKGLYMALGTKMGVGSIIGVAICIFIGGVGSIFWLIIFSIISSSFIYYESILGSKNKQKINNIFLSGPYFYIKNKINNKTLAVISSIILIICYSFLFQMIQTNTLYELIKYTTHINDCYIYLFFIILILPIIFFDLKEIKNSMNKIVPFMCIIFVIISIIGIALNINLIPKIIISIFKDAFNINSILTGMIIGIKQSVFMSETLVGTTSVSCGVSEELEEREASLQTLAVYFTNIIVTILMSFLIIIFLFKTDYNLLSYNILLSDTFLFLFGSIGNYLLIIILLLFAITTILSGFYIGIEFTNILFNKTIFLFIFKILICISLFSGLLFKPLFIWQIVDIFMFILIFINLYSIIKILKEEKNDKK